MANRLLLTNFGARSILIDTMGTTAVLPSGVTYDATITHGGTSRSLKSVAASGANNAVAFNTIDSYVRVWVRITARPSTTARILLGAVGSGRVNIRLNPNGTLAYYVNTTLIGTSTTALTDTSRWYRVEYLSGNLTGALLRIDGVDEITATTTTAVNSPLSLGPADTVADTYTAYFAELVTDAVTWVGESSVLMVTPTADTTVGSGWQKPGGATTTLFDSIDSHPPIGVADSTNVAQAANQIRNASSNSAAYTATLPDAVTAGVVSGSTPIWAHAWAIVGAPSATGAKTGSMGFNWWGFAPANAAFSDINTNFYSGAVAGTYPTGWKYEYVPDQGTGSASETTPGTMNVTITGGTASRIAMVCSMGLYVEYTLPLTGAAPGTGAISYTGFAPNVVVAPAGTVVPGNGALTYTGFAPTVWVTPVYKAGGRTFDQSRTAPVDKLVFGVDASLADLHKRTGGFSCLMACRRTSDVDNQFMAGTSTGATVGWEFLQGYFTGNTSNAGHLRLIVWTSGTRYDTQTGATGAVGQTVQNQHELVGFDFDSVNLSGQNGTQFFRGKIQEPIAVEANAAANIATGSGTPGSDAANALWAFNEARGNSSFMGDGSWMILATPRLTLAEKWDIQLGLLMVEAGDTVRGQTLLRKSGKVVLARRINNDGTTSEYGPSTVASTLTGTTAGETLNNDNTGASRSLVCSITALRNDAERVPVDGVDRRDQGDWRYATDFAGALFNVGATASVTLWGYQTFTDSTYAAQQKLGVENNGAYFGQVAGSGGGMFSGTVSGMASGTVEVLTGPRSRSGTLPAANEPQEGTYLSLAVFDTAATFVPEPARTAVVRLFTDSVWAFVGNPASQYGVIMQLRRALPSAYDAIEQAGYAGAALSVFTANAAIQTQVVKRLTAGNPARIVISLGANDKISSTISAATYQTRLAGLVDEILAVSSFTGRIILYSQLLTTSQEGTNGFGNNMDAYRTAVATVQSTRTSRVDYRNGKTIVTSTQINGADGVHLLNTGLTLLAADLTTALTAAAVIAPGTGALTFTGFAPAVTVSNNKNIAAGTGAEVLAGFAPAVAVSNNKNIAPGVGSEVLAGFSPSVVIGTRVLAGVGSLTLTGLSPVVTVSNNQNVLAGAGAVTLSGFAPSVVIGTRVLAGVGSLSLTGLSPTVVASNNQNIAAGLGALTISGFAPGIVVGVRVLAGAGVLTLTGFAPVVSVSNNQNIAAGLGAVVLTGFAPSVALSNNQNVAAGVGVLSLSGLAPSVVIGTRVLAGVGALTISGFSPSIAFSSNRNVLPGTGAITFAGFAPAAIVNVRVLAGVGALALAGFAPSVSVSDNKNVQAGFGLLSFAGFAPTVVLGTRVLANTGILSLTGFAPTVSITDRKVVLPGTGGLTYIGQAPTVSVGNVITANPGKGALLLTAFAPVVSVSNNKVVNPGTGAAVFTGFAPTAVAQDNRVIAPSSGSITFTGFAPVVTATDSKKVLTDTGTLVYVGYAPTVFASDTRVATPGTGLYNLTGFAPSVDATDIQVALPDFGSLILTGFEPIVTASSATAVGPQTGQLIYGGHRPTIVGVVLDLIISQTALIADDWSAGLTGDTFLTRLTADDFAAALQPDEVTTTFTPD